MNLADHVRQHVAEGSIDRGVSLGFAKMPDGYELMQADSGHYYWLCQDGDESDIHWNRWAVWRWAKLNAVAKKRDFSGEKVARDKAEGQ